ncbi:MAG: hypothetical protein M3256_20025 [Actinomycetota bacterium]|nr:hypothetical protein [Actinomycetota bacterium]
MIALIGSGNPESATLVPAAVVALVVLELRLESVELQAAADSATETTRHTTSVCFL